MSQPDTEAPEPTAPDAPTPETPETPETPAPETPDTPVEAPDTEPDTVSPFTAPETAGEGETFDAPDEQHSVRAPSVEAQKRQQDKDREKLDRETERHDKRVREIMGEDAQYLLNCPLCGDVSPGFLMVQEEGVISDEHLATLKSLLGIGLPSQLKQHPTVHKCETCDGKGECSTGSERQGYEAIQCPTCAGKGWEGLGVPAESVVQGNGSGAAQTMTGPTVYAAPPATDPVEDDPAALALRERGWLVVAPIPTNTV